MTKFKKGIAAVLSAALCMTSLPVTGLYTVMAADATNLTAHYDMSHEGNSLKDVSGKGNDATLYATDDSAFAEYNGEITMQFDNQEYATIPSGLLGANGEFTIQTVVSVPTTGDNWVWCIGDRIGAWGQNNISDYIFLSANSKQGSYANKVFGAIKVGDESNGGETRMPVPADTLGTGYATIAMVSDGTNLSIYVDGVLHSTLEHGHNVADIIPDGNIIGYIGQSLYSADAKLVGNIADIKIWNTALTADELAAEVPSAEEEITMIMADIVPTLLNGNASLDKIKSNVAFPSSIDGIAMTWNIPENSAIAANGAVTTPVGNNVEVEVGVSFAFGGETKSASYTLTVLGENAENLLQSAYDELDIPNKADVRGNITLPEEIGKGVQITWATDHPEIIDLESHPASVANYDEVPAGVVTRPEKDTAVKLTATLNRDGNTMTKEFTLNVKAAPKKLEESDFTDYFFPYFTGEGYSNGEQIYFSASQDGLHWKVLNDNNPVLTSQLGEKGVRDPHIIRSPEGDTFYLIATDLKIYNGNGWDAAQNRGSQSLMVWESHDLVNWSEQRMVEVSADIGAGCTWAPESAYDPVTGEYIVFWASRTPAVDNKQRVYYAKTRDFYTFTSPKVFVDLNQSTIDSTIIYHDGTYYRYSKNEGSSRNELGASGKRVFIQKSDNVLGTYTSIPSSVMNSQPNVEGPAIFKLNQDDADGDQWCLLLDNYGGVAYYPLITTDLDSGEFTEPSDYSMPGRARHGTPIRITAEEYAAVMEAYKPYKNLVENMPTNLQYFIDCNNPNSDYYAILDEYADLFNEVPDKAYTEGSWGYVVNGTYGNYDGDDRFEAGWWARSGQSIDYTVPLEAGQYKVTFGLREWWNVSRPMTISMTANGTTTTLGNVNSRTSDGTNRVEATYTITLEEAADVAFKVAKATNQDPVLSFIQIQHILDLEALETAIAAAEAADKAQYTADELAAIDAAVAAGKDLRLKSATTQAQADEGAAAIMAALEKTAEPIVLPYTDVAEADWFYNAAYYAYVEDIMTGVDETTFAPGLEMTRAQLALMLYRLAGKPGYTKEAQFPDLEEGAWYLDAVNWAVENNIISGYAHNGLFAPHDNVTREQAAVMLYNYAEYAGADTDAAADLSEYEDAASVSEWAKAAMQWAVGESIITGRDGKLLAPQGTTSRAEGANIIYNFMK